VEESIETPVLSDVPRTQSLPAATDSDGEVGKSKVGKKGKKSKNKKKKGDES
jgi:hypothetical protein